MMTFDEWYAIKRRPFGSAYKDLARKAWDAALEHGTAEIKEEETTEDEVRSVYLTPDERKQMQEALNAAIRAALDELLAKGMSQEPFYGPSIYSLLTNGD